ncbi:MAG TPA: nucleotide-binding protein [Syntrophorhabdaceae bacterium]|nr:nucleotide-binding protein [Syntrophorhabdaceae bacterium]
MTEKMKKVSEATASEKKKRRYIAQTDVPSNMLEDALRVPRAIFDHYAGKAATPLQVASALKMTPSSGTFRMLCGSSIAYGLTSGGYNAKIITPEPLVRRILRPLEEGDDLTARREAALKPRVMGEFIRKYDNAPLPRQDIALNVLQDMGVPAEKAGSVYALILETAQSVGLIREIKNRQYIDLNGMDVASKPAIEVEDEESSLNPPAIPEVQTACPDRELGQGIFVAHGKNKKPLDQLKKILDQFKIPCKVAVEEPNLGRPIGTKIKEIMESCNCAILIFTADEEFTDKEGNAIWRPSENVVYELGASSYLYGSRIVILKEEGVEFATNFRDLGYISFEKEQLEAKSFDVLKELIGFGIVKVST